MKEKTPKQRKKPGRIPTSCAECRRNKLKCERTFPCEQCVRRGCGAICPSGELESGKGNRLNLSGTAELHARIDHLCARIRDLEVALNLANPGHDLLRLDLLRIKAPTNASLQPETISGIAATPTPPFSIHTPHSLSPVTDQVVVEHGEFLDSNGTLTLAKAGEMSWHGPGATVEHLLYATPDELSDPDSTTDVDEDDAPSTPTTLGSSGVPSSLLPPTTEFPRLCQLYFDATETLFIAPPVLTRDEAFASLQSCKTNSEPPLVLSILAIGALFDSSYKPSADTWNGLAMKQTSLYLACQWSETRSTRHLMKTLQTVLNLVLYEHLSKPSLSESAWLLLGHCVRLCVAAGMHLDDTRWRMMSRECAESRRRMFWTVWHMDVWMSLLFGRPPSLDLTLISCASPQYVDSVVVEDSYHRWTHKFTKLLHRIISTTASGLAGKHCSAKDMDGSPGQSLSYLAVVQLDAEIRNFTTPENLRWVQPNGDDMAAVGSKRRLLERFGILCMKEIAILSLHRPYAFAAFSASSVSSSTDISKHRYMPSVLASFKASWRLLTALGQLWSHCKSIPIPANPGKELMLERLPSVWNAGLSAASVFALLTTRAPRSKFAPVGLKLLETTVALFQEASDASCEPARALVQTIRSFHSAARESMSSSDGPFLAEWGVKLDRIAGGSTFLHSCLPEVTTPSSSVSSMMFPASGSLHTWSSSSSHQSYRSLLHPSIRQDLDALEVAAIELGLALPSHIIGSFDDTHHTESTASTSPLSYVPDAGDVDIHMSEPAPDTVIHSPLLSTFNCAYSNYLYGMPSLPLAAPMAFGFGSQTGGFLPITGGFGAMSASVGVGVGTMPFSLDRSWQPLLEQLGF